MDKALYPVRTMTPNGHSDSNGTCQASSIRSRRPVRLFLSLLSLFVISSLTLPAEVVEWELRHEGLAARTSNALLRYYTVVRGDSASTRYLTSGTTAAVYLRAQVTQNDPVGRLLMIRYGQLQLFATEDIRIALGEELYNSLLATRSDPDAGTVPLSLGDRYGHNDWIGNHTVVWSLFDRIDVRISERMNVFAALGAPESGRDFWSDGTGRVGIAHPAGELALLFPYSGGSVGLGDWFTGRILSPGIGASLQINAGDVHGRIRYTVPFEGTINATRAVDDAWVPTLSCAVAWDLFEFDWIGLWRLQPGLSFEEVTRIFDGGGRGLIRSGYNRRLAPGGSVSIDSPDQTLRLDLGVYNLSLRAVATARLSAGIWFEVRMSHNDLLRAADPFEAPVTLFMTPRFKF